MCNIISGCQSRNKTFTRAWIILLLYDEKNAILGRAVTLEKSADYVS